MKFKQMAVLGLLAAFAAGCSKDTPEIDPNAWKYDESLPVPIQFGVPNFRTDTKAAIPSIGSMEGLPVGVFAWGEGSSASMRTSARSIFENDYLRAQVISSGGAYSLKFVEYGQSPETSVPVYYPMSSDYNYSFYAYHTGDENISGTYESGNNSYVVNVSMLEPFKDILWGKCSDDSLRYNDLTLPHLKYKGTVIKGFNSRFSRAAVAASHESSIPVQESDYYPAIAFKHACTSFRFYAKTDPELTKEQLELLLGNLTINSVVIKQTPASANLVVASTDSLREGVLEPSVARTDVTMTLGSGVKPIKDDEGNGRLLKSSDGKEDRFFLPPGDYSDVTASLKLTIGGKNYSLDFPMKFEGNSKFEAGRCYSFVVIFKSLEEINMKVSLSNWDENNYTTVDTDYQ